MRLDQQLIDKDCGSHLPTFGGINATFTCKVTWLANRQGGSAASPITHLIN